jgi:hypothetical protein
MLRRISPKNMEGPRAKPVGLHFCFNSSTYVKSKDFKVKPLVFHGGNRRAFHSLAPRGNRHGRSIGTVFWY